MPCSLSAAASAEPRATCSMRRLRLRGAHCSLPPAPPSPPSSSGHGSSSTCLFSLLVESLPAQVRQRSSLSGCTKARSASPPGPCSRHPAGNTATCRQVAGEYGDCTSACESGDSAGVYESDSGWPACATLLSFSLFPSDSEPQSQRISPSILATIIFAAFTAPIPRVAAWHCSLLCTVPTHQSVLEMTMSLLKYSQKTLAESLHSVSHRQVTQPGDAGHHIAPQTATSLVAPRMT